MDQRSIASALKEASASHGNRCGGNGFVSKGPKGRFMCRPRDIVRDSVSTAQPAHHPGGKKPPKGGITFSQNRRFEAPQRGFKGGGIAFQAITFTLSPFFFSFSQFFCFFCSYLS